MSEKQQATVSEKEQTVVSAKEQALHILFQQEGVEIEDVKFFVDRQNNPSEEDVWGQFAAALCQQRDGTAIVTRAWKDPTPKKNIRNLLNA